MVGSTSFKSILVSGTALAALTCALPGAAFAQGTDPTQAPAPVTTLSQADVEQEILVTGSSIKRRLTDSALPLQIITPEDISREGINNPEQLIALLSSNGNSADNLASNVDVVEGAQRGTNGISAANLRNQGSGATLILLNGRRVAAHGLSGSAVDVNQIPLAAVERVEVLKDGASAVYGTDAIGGVINFILKKNFQGVTLTGFVDATEHGGGNIYRMSGTAGVGDLDDDGYNFMVAASYSDHRMLRGDQRDFTSGFQSDRGLSPDTRGTPFATIFPLAGDARFGTTNAMLLFPNAASTPFVPGTTTRASGGLNILDLPNGAGCAAGEDMDAYDVPLWGNDITRTFACTWDSSRAAVIQQPLQTLSMVARGVVRLGEHEISAEYVGSWADAAKRFSHPQYSASVSATAPLPLYYPRTAANAATYDTVFNALRAAFPTIPESDRGKAISYRWRCIPCGPREIETETDTARYYLGADGPLTAGWDYRTGISYATSQSQSTLGSGYHYRGITPSGAVDVRPGIVQALNSGIINPFLLDGQTQSAEAQAAIDAVSAEGVVLYGGEFSVLQIDGSASGPLFRLPAGMVMAAVGVDYRKEMYHFDGDQRAAADRPLILNAPFDDQNALPDVSRTVKAVYAELLIPAFKGFELTGAVRLDDYTGFGQTVNPKVSFRFSPARQITFRGSYNTGFRVPSFNQLFNGRLTSPLPGTDLADPATCPGGRANGTIVGCETINPNSVTGGNPLLGPEESEGYSVGVVLEPVPWFTAMIDYWKINRTGTITTLTLTELITNYDLFEDRFTRDGAGEITEIDRSVINAGASKNEGIDVTLRFSHGLGAGTLSAGLDGTYLIRRVTQLVPNVPFSANEVGLYTPSGDLSLRWKHNLYLTYRQGPWSVSVSQIFRKGNTNRKLLGVANGTVTRPDLVEVTDDYFLHNLSASYQLFENLKITAGVRNVFDREPPFAITYSTDLGSGGAWEPRVADPRGRSFTFAAEVKF